jgi:hypothetical protein
MIIKDKDTKESAAIGTTPAYKGQRNFKTGAYHFCARCGSRVLISDLQWQRGLLVCKKWDCIDTGVYPLAGEREAAMAHALEIPTNELQPDPKLITPTDSGSSVDDDIIF